jgi:phosphatidylglycerol:prolipoprotein diacylglycerol transferase
VITHHPFRFNIGPLELTGFGIAMVLSFVIAQYVGEAEMRRRGEDPKPVADLTLAGVIGGLLGAKIYYAILHGESVFARDGFVFWGGLIGGLAAAWFVIHSQKLSYARMSDVAAPCIAAAYAVGRTGCWAVGDDYGRPWDGALAVSFPQGAPPSTGENLMRFGAQLPEGTRLSDVFAVHPTQLYEVTLSLLIFAVLWRIRAHKHAVGWLFGAYAAMAGAERFFVEIFRAKDDRFFGPLTMAQMIGLGFVLFGVTWMYLRRTPAPGKPGIASPA